MSSTTPKPSSSQVSQDFEWRPNPDFQDPEARDRRLVLDLDRRVDESVFVTLAEGVDRLSEAGQILQDGCEVRILEVFDSQDASKPGPLVRLQFKALSGLRIRRAERLDRSAEFTPDLEDLRVRPAKPGEPVLQRIQYLRNHLLKLEDATEVLKEDVRKGNAEGRRYPNHSRHHVHVLRREELAEIQKYRQAAVYELRLLVDGLRLRAIQASENYPAVLALQHFAELAKQHLPATLVEQLAEQAEAAAQAQVEAEQVENHYDYNEAASFQLYCEEQVAQQKQGPRK